MPVAGEEYVNMISTPTDEGKLGYLKDQIDFYAQKLELLKANKAWIQTFSGLQVYPLAMTSGMISIKDIAHALSLKCRYGGHCIEFFSVAEHSVYVAQLVRQVSDRIDDTKWALLHDATEAYLPDVARPIKSFIEGFRAIEHQCERAIIEKFDLYPDIIPYCVKRADTTLLYKEKDAIMLHGSEWEHTDNLYYVPTLKINCWTPKQAEEEFLKMYTMLWES